MTFKDVHTGAGVRPLSNKERRALEKSLRCIGPLSEEHRSRTGLYATIGVIAVGAIAAVMAVKKGKTANEDNVGILCSDETGLELVGRTEKGVEFRTTKIRETPEDIQLAARFGAPIPYMIGMNYAEGYRSGTVTFKTDESGRMIPAGTYKLDSAAAQSMDLGPLLQVSSCWENVKEKLRIAGQNAELRLRLASGNTQASAPHHSQDRGNAEKKSKTQKN